MSRSSKTLKPLFEPYFVETSGWLQNVTDENTYQKYPAAMTYDVPFLRHVTSNKACFLISSIVYRLISKLVHTLIGPILYTLQKKCIDQNNVAYNHGNQISHYIA